MNKQTIYLSWISGILVSFIALAAFILSFDAIRALAETNGVPHGRSWLVPLVVDGAMLVFSVSVLRASLAQEKQYWGWLLIIAFTAASVLFNIAHSNLTPLGMALAALAPLALLATFETLMSQIKSAMKGRINYLADKWRRRAVILLTLAKQWRQEALENNQRILGLLSDIDNLRQEIEIEKQNHDKTRQALAEVKTEKNELKRQLSKDAIQLDKLPPRLASYVTQVASGITPNGDYSEEWGIGVTTLQRANSMFLNGD